jgi:serine phosphatase RsbU (regulator of sigma subunit)
VLAEKFYRKTLFILKSIDEPISEAASLNGIAHIHLADGNIDSATYYLDKSMEIRLKINDPYGLANNYLMQMDLCLAKNNVSDAIDAGNKAMENAIQSKYLLAQRDIAERMYKIYKSRNEPFKALQMHELYYSLRDSIDKTENQKEIIRREYSYQYEKQRLSDSLRREEDKRIDDERHRSELQQEETRRNSLFVILALVLLFALFIFNRFRVIKKQRDVIRIKEEETARQKAMLAHQNEMLEEKQKEIFDSINYARRLQDAILPPNKLVQILLPDGFILYKPKDIVAGDFYWLESTGAATYLAAADCTGHGVPGAMVSVVCSNALTKALHEDKLTEPGKILDRTRELVIEQFARSEQEVKDGMDISLVAWPHVGTDGHLSVQWAGANNPLWIIKDGTNEVIEIKADKQPVGNYSNALPFTTHPITLQKGDAIYIFTDGYQDQFGGEKGKKFKAANLKSFLLSIVHHPAEKQCELLLEEFDRWKGTHEQIDDVCVIGVRL